jgi:hypothetical protein
MKNKKLGPTKDYPRGKLNNDDDGGLAIGVGRDRDGVIIIEFGTSVKWIGLDQATAIGFAQLILKHANEK